MLKYVSLDEVTALAESLSANVTDREKAFFPQWAFEALPFLGIADDEIEVCVIKPKELVAPKPKDLRVLIDIALYAEDVSAVPPTKDIELPHIFRTGKKRINQVTRYPNDINIDGTSSEFVDVSEDQKHIILGTNGKHVKSIMIRYFAYPLDERGQPMFRQDDKIAVAWFIKWMLASRREENQSAIQNAWGFWARYADLAKARSKMIHHEQAKTTMRKFVNLIPSYNQKDF